MYSPAFGKTGSPWKGLILPAGLSLYAVTKALKSLRRQVFHVDIGALPEMPTHQLTPLEQLYYEEIEKHIQTVMRSTAAGTQEKYSL